ncbi:MAG: hypothetical protein JJU13_13290 [Balneolaceae bacterium]|nr:hypothetical protein [Balneolaceae bacterium]
MNLSNIKYRNLIVILIYEHHTLARLFGENENYSTLLHELARYTGDKYMDLPNQKELLKSLNISRSKLMKIMHKLYDDFLEKIKANKGYKIRETQIWYRLSSFEDYWTIGVHKLERIPRIGEHIEVPFLRNYIKCIPTFVVTDVHHQLESGIHRIDIHMRDRLQNKDIS